MALKVVLMTLMVLFSLGTMPFPLAGATRVDVAELLSAIEIPTGKTGDSSWCDNCVCTKSNPPYCRCTDASLCTKCVCYLFVPAAVKSTCESIASKFDSFCPSSVATTAERTQFILN
ncbi:seed trypsin/chymotrypsin inhibitor TI5-72-like [Telopea speciosissima]|uniref:seed trypsin/chymotrypsin inhibitor TI5-72-like n=1 Tax=Telopea speciosissima TaxID=54955 RepID=UPI001CC56942|nr:seed trypsin/chymotrypsin inhibitor TI5-72-like [Telopea speciosissima]